MKKTICIDFDGVLHSYESGWQGVDVIADGPVEGAVHFLITLLSNDDFEVCVYSSRSKSEKGINAMKCALIMWFMAERINNAVMRVNQIVFPTQKPAAWLTIDDRAICFTGKFPTITEILNFKPWNKQ
jgi:hypothetical protein